MAALRDLKQEPAPSAVLKGPSAMARFNEKRGQRKFTSRGHAINAARVFDDAARFAYVYPNLRAVKS